MSSAIVSLKNISKKFGSKEVFKNFSMNIEEGDFVCITGKSGAGKSTLLNIIGMLDSPDEGEVIIKSCVNPKFNSKTGRNLLRNEIFYVFQNYGLADDRTVKYNLEMAAEFSGKKSDNNYREALEKVGLNADYLNQKVYTLSGGEQQRCALARIYLKNYSIVLADEPTGSLDSDNRDKVMEILRSINEEGRTVIVVTHDPEVVKCAKRTVEL